MKNYFYPEERIAIVEWERCCRMQTMSIPSGTIFSAKSFHKRTAGKHFKSGYIL